MPLRIEDYALIGNRHTAALVGRDGSIDWLCVPRFDDAACFCALLGTHEHGRWLMAPARPIRRTSRRYRDRTLILETEFETATGAVRVVDFMPVLGDRTEVVRIVDGVRGHVPMRMELVMRFGYGSVIPWVHRADGALLATSGPLSAQVRAAVDTRGEDFRTVAEFTVERGQRLPFVITFFPSHETRPLPLDPFAMEDATRRDWEAWCARCAYRGPWHDAVVRSLITLKSLTHAPTGGIVAAPTTSLPETIGGTRNWDYRYCWVRDATFTLYALLQAGYRDEASAWHAWLLRSAAGRPDDLQTLYRGDGDRVRVEFALPWLPGYEGSAPVRVGNAASVQFQLDVYGELIDALGLARDTGLDGVEDAWKFERAIVRFVEKSWIESGPWHLGNARREAPLHALQGHGVGGAATGRFAVSRSTACAGPVTRWRRLRARIHDDVCRKGFDRGRKSFVQYYGATEVDASLLLIPQVGFLPADDPRVRGTIAAVERDLIVDGLVLRYRTAPQVDGLPPGEGAFLPCSFWLADALRCAAATATPRSSSRDSSHCATTSDCWPRSTIPSAGGCSATSRRR